MSRQAPLLPPASITASLAGFHSVLTFASACTASWYSFALEIRNRFVSTAASSFSTMTHPQELVAACLPDAERCPRPAFIAADLSEV
jgi:hypothetical protein